MRKRKYRAGVAAVLVGAVLFSPLLCGMTCLEGRGVRQSGSVDVAAPVAAEELVGKIAGSALFGCGLSHAVSRIDFSEWADQVDVGTWVWIGIKALRLSDGLWREVVLQS